MARLKNRNMQIPYGLKFYDANLKWTSRENMSFTGICQGVLNARLANPGVTKAKGLSTDMRAIENEVDQFNAAICEQHGWTEYITSGAGGAASVPFSNPVRRPPSRGVISRLKNLAAGSSVIVEWLESGAEAVPQEQANQRAGICVQCPKNGTGGWEKYFTEPASNAIRAVVNRKREMKLQTPLDDKLGVCEACDCPMVLKIWLPLAKFLPKMSETAKGDLSKENPKCWILVEAGL
jgi:hypothetical protein